MKVSFKRRKTEWRKKRKLKQRLRNKLDNHRRKAGGRFTPAQWFDKLEEFNHSCAYCGMHQSALKGALEVEHVIPLSREGAHHTNNIVPACRKCNAEKGDSTLEEWEERLNGGHNHSSE